MIFNFFFPVLNVVMLFKECFYKGFYIIKNNIHNILIGPIIKINMLE